MNTFALLLAASCAPGADPVTLVQYSTPSSSAAYSGMTETVQEPRPRFFGRIRAFFNRRSQNAETMPTESVPSYARSTSSSSFNGTLISPAPTASPSISPAPIGPSILVPSGSAMPSAALPAQRMPSGNPF